jgi:ABC-type phosphate/phosphonate transport system substrate-binding protein
MRREMLAIYESPPITRGVLVMRRGLAKPMRAALVNALTAMHENADGQQVLEGLSKVTRYDRFEGEAKEVLDRSRELLAPALKSKVAAR